ncbi:hypothetical protein [Streptomyces cyslabdanicus]|uniref:hypothetical protein n=1 Tax=Streptomyces cyslabdanicus TaxID=1470456 RepID=UPI004043EC99
MGWIKDAQADTVREDAQRAVDEGRTVFVCRVNQGVLQDSTSGSLSDVAEQIEAVEALGWQLDHANFSHDQRNQCSAFLIFRRPLRRSTEPHQQAPQ